MSIDRKHQLFMVPVGILEDHRDIHVITQEIHFHISKEHGTGLIQYLNFFFMTDTREKNVKYAHNTDLFLIYVIFLKYQHFPISPFTSL